MALRISFSVCVRWRRSFRRSLSDCKDEVVVVRRFSLVSRSRTWRSFRSRKARCLLSCSLAQAQFVNRHAQLTLPCSVLSFLTVLESKSLCLRYWISCLLWGGFRCPNRGRDRCRKSHCEVRKGAVQEEMLSLGYVLLLVRCHQHQRSTYQSCIRTHSRHSHWRRRKIPCSARYMTSAHVTDLLLNISLTHAATLTSTAPLPSWLAPCPSTLLSWPKPK